MSLSWISGISKLASGTVNLFSHALDASPAQTSFEQERPALLVTRELDNAIEDCKKKVAQISKTCRAKNRRYRDTEFDIRNDKDLCLHGLSRYTYAPSDVQRVSDIFEDPQFFIDGPSSSDLVQGGIHDCWFIAALAGTATAPGLVEKFCVARDELVGVYGFVFFRDTTWVSVIIDDLLFTAIPKYEELHEDEKMLYHKNKDTYNNTARRGGKSLLFARSETENETWVPLIEKAYAKLHGNYHSLDAGHTSEAIEDLTGGVSSHIQTEDILDVDRFWTEELLNVNQDRLFGCHFYPLDTQRRRALDSQTANGLIANHAYSVLRAAEYNGKRFLVIRNPWGRSEWTGPWSDGSKEWTREWLDALSALGHVFGNDGQFIMEYKDFLSYWQCINRTLLFDSTWVMSSHWLQVPARPFESIWAFGDVSFTLSLKSPSLTIIVLSELDNRYFRGLEGNSIWAFDFIVYKKGEAEEIAESSKSLFNTRSVNVELELEAGEYVIHVRLDRDAHTKPTWPKSYNQRTLARVLAEKAKSCSIAENFKSREHGMSIPIPRSLLAGRDLATLEQEASEFVRDDAFKQASIGVPPFPQNDAVHSAPTLDGEAVDDSPPNGLHTAKTDNTLNDSEEEFSLLAAIPDKRITVPYANKDWVFPHDDNTVYIGLRVYTNKAAPAVLGGQLRDPTKDLSALAKHTAKLSL
ncbi:hypothetical protein BDZ94DRAFT_1215779 [Collybia nuda]|uniref:Calpain catalytic domain-containing protein n=1 Tax=Collybia nuda TaxID=64659 RepID=A0A9P6CG71_9AGAR|nr:hypothetical protein BDZ94DRAFT_1215779 [Collybia nuda]